jgi:hypothetical protein
MRWVASAKSNVKSKVEGFLDFSHFVINGLLIITPRLA